MPDDALARHRRPELLDVVRPLPADVGFLAGHLTPLATDPSDAGAFGAFRQGLFLLPDGAWLVRIDAPPGPVMQPGTRTERWVDRRAIRALVPVDERCFRLEAEPEPLLVCIDAWRDFREASERRIRGWLGPG